MIYTDRAYAMADADQSGVTAQVRVTQVSGSIPMFGVQQVVRYGSMSDAVAAGDLVVDRFLVSLRKLARN